MSEGLAVEIKCEHKARLAVGYDGCTGDFELPEKAARHIPGGFFAWRTPHHHDFQQALRRVASPDHSVRNGWHGGKAILGEIRGESK